MTETGPFADFGSYQAIERLGELRLSPDGRRLVATVSVLSDDGSKRVEAVWELDVTNFPAVVTMDAHGTSLHQAVEAESKKKLQAVFA